MTEQMLRFDCSFYNFSGIISDIEALKESVSDKLFSQEPLAEAIISYLNQSNPAAHREIMDVFDKIISARIDSLIKDALENDTNIEKYPR